MLKHSLICGLLLSGVQAHAQDALDPAEQHARNMLDVIDAVVAHHVDPPARQQLVLAVCRELAGPGTLGLSREVSRATTDAALLGLLIKHTRGLMERYPDGADRPGQALQLALSQVAGAASVATSENHRVSRQVAENRYVGTGIRLSMEPGPVMQKVFEAGPAYLAGAKDGDRIESIDGESTAGQTIQTVIQKLRGPRGSKVTVTLRQPESEQVREYTITRGVVPIASVEKPKFAANRSVGYIRFVSIGASSVHELRKIESDLTTETKHVVFDFRNLMNHDLHHARLLASSLLDGVTIGSVTTPDGRQTHTAESGSLFASLQLTILVDASTMGTPEWIAAALFDNKRANIVGQNTAGRGFIKSAIEVRHMVVELATGLLHRSDGTVLVPSRPADPMMRRVVARQPSSGTAENTEQSTNVTPGPLVPNVKAEIVKADPLQAVSAEEVATIISRVRSIKPLASDNSVGAAL